MGQTYLNFYPILEVYLEKYNFKRDIEKYKELDWNIIIYSKIMDAMQKFLWYFETALIIFIDTFTIAWSLDLLINTCLRAMHQIGYDMVYLK